MQRVLLFTLLIALTYANISIDHFDARGTSATPSDKSGIYANHVELEAKLKNCAPCQCYVGVNGTTNDQYALKFADNKHESGSVQISGLTVHTTYSFTLTCTTSTEGQASNSVTHNKIITTDDDRPLAPVNVAAELESSKLKITWQAPPGAIVIADAHIVKIDGKANEVDRATIYRTTTDYAYDTNHTISVAACRHNNQKDLVCSPDNTNTIFFKESITTTTTTTTSTTSTTTTTTTVTTPKSTGACSFSLSIPVIISSLFLVMTSQW